MISAYLYQYVYLFIITVLTLLVRPKYSKLEYYQENDTKSNNVNAIIIIVLISLFIGLRPLDGHYFGDTGAYAHMYYASLDGNPFKLDLSARDPIFLNLFSLWGSLRLGCSNFMVLVAFVNFGCTYLGIKRFFPNDDLAVFIVSLAAFSTFTYATNGIRAGMATGIFILAISYYDKIWVCLLLSLISYGIHHSMQMPLAALLLTYFIKNPKYYFFGWIFCLIMSVLHVQFFANMFAGFSDDTGADYLTAQGEDAYVTGFRPDFVLYSAVPVIIGYYLIYHKGIQISPVYERLINFYLCTNGIWMLCMYASFTNRIAYLSWFIYPIVLIYPIFYENWGQNQNKMFAKVMTYHLCFTLFMELVYYKLLK